MDPVTDPLMELTLTRELMVLLLEKKNIYIELVLKYTLKCMKVSVSGRLQLEFTIS